MADQSETNSFTSSTPVIPALTDSTSSQETPKRLKSTLERIRSSVQRPKLKKETRKTTWYTSSLSIGSSLGSFGSQKNIKKDEEGVEMSTITTIQRQQSQPPPAITDLTGSSSFSYVNLENFIGMGEYCSIILCYV